MSKRFKPPFHIEVDFYDAKGKPLEWADWWGPCPDAAEVLYVVTDIEDRTISTHNTRERAQAAIDRLNASAAFKSTG